MHDLHVGFTGTRVDLEAAQRMLDDGERVLRVAQALGISPQRIYQLLNEGQLQRPDPAASSG